MLTISISKISKKNLEKTFAKRKVTNWKIFTKLAKGTHCQLRDLQIFQKNKGVTEGGGWGE